MSEEARRCTKCGETKPLSAFHLKKAGDPNGPRRTHCAACSSAAARRRYAEGPSVAWQLVRHGTDRPELLSEKARAAVYTDQPINPQLLAAYRARQKANAARGRRQERQRVGRGGDLQHYWKDRYR